jgi:hypothetical protein
VVLTKLVRKASKDKIAFGLEIKQLSVEFDWNAEPLPHFSTMSK